MLPQVAIYTLAVVVPSIVGQTLNTLLAPKEAKLPLDERERQIVDRAGALLALAGKRLQDRAAFWRRL